MKYAAVILAGGADESIGELEGRTPLETARTPALDEVAKSGRVGLVATAPEELTPGVEVCARAMLGMDPRLDIGQMDSFQNRYDVSACLVATDASVAEIARQLGVEPIAPGNLSSGDDSGVRAIGDAATTALDSYDLVIAWASGADAASLAGDAQGKVEAIERIDASIVSPILARLRTFGDPESDRLAGPGAGWRLLACADRTIECATGETTRAPAPFAMAGAWVRSVVEHPMDERHARGGDLFIDRGHELMEYFLYSAIRRPRVRRRARSSEAAHERA